MKVSLNWVKEFTDVKGSVDDVVKQIGAQLGGVDEVIDLGKKYQDIVIVKVVKCTKHPDADKLSVCFVDDGGKVKGVKREDGLVQVVCGAPNVRAGMMAVWLPPGSTVPASYDKEPLVLEARQIRGETSNGMLASASELAISEDHSGILEIMSESWVAKSSTKLVSHVEALTSYKGLPDIKPGDDFAEKYGLNDHIIDIENKMFTHRPDLFGLLGVAREVAGIQHKPFDSPSWYQGERTTGPYKNRGELTVKNELPSLVPRFMAQVVHDVDIMPSALSIQAKLVRVGIKPINNIVDVTNYVMYLTGQPMHAYDYDKLCKLDGSKTATIMVRSPKPGEKIKLLGGKEIEPRKADIVIASAKHLIGLGGVMGGQETEVDENTKNIVLECATFDMYSIRRTAMEHGLFTDAVTRFTKGQSPWQNDKVLALVVSMIDDPSGPSAAYAIHDLKAKLPEPARVSVSAEFVNARLGTNLSLKDMAKLLENVEFKMASVPANKKDLHVIAPFWRTDIEIPEDIVEEIGRLYGYDKLPVQLPKRSINPAPTDPLLATKTKAREVLARAGANEVLTYSFVHGDLLKKVGQNAKFAYEITNAISPDLQYYRLSLLPSLLDKVHPNIKAGYGQFAIFEINPVHCTDYVDEKTNLPIEDQRIALVFAADEKSAKDYAGAPYYQAQRYMRELLINLGVEYVLEPAASAHHAPRPEIGKAAIAPFEKTRSVYVKTADGLLLGELGEFRAEVRRNLKLPAYVAGFELDMERIMQQSNSATYQPIPRFPKIDQDITLKVHAKVSFAELNQLVVDSLTESRPANTQLTTTLLGIYQKDDERGYKHVTFRVSLASYQRTLTTDEVSKLLDDLAQKATDQLKAVRA